jgi:hypothetical protein
MRRLGRQPCKVPPARDFPFRRRHSEPLLPAQPPHLAFAHVPAFLLEQGRDPAVFAYNTFLLSGWLHGRRVGKQFVFRDEALGEKNALEVEAANMGGEIRARNTRLSVDQLAEAEASIARLGTKSLSLAVE